LLLGWRLGFYECFNSRLGGFLSLAMHFKVFLRWIGFDCTFIGEREQSWECFAHQPCGRSIRLCISPLGWRNAGLHLLRIALHGRWDTHSSVSSLQTQQIPPLKQAPNRCWG
jgi:hypothetical protein